MSRVTNYFKNRRTKSDFVVCLSFSLLSIIALSLIMATVLSMTQNPTSLIDVCSLATTLICAIAGGIFVSRYKKDSGIGYSALVILSTVVIMIICALIINKGRIYTSALMNYACYIGVAILSAYIGKNRTKRKRRKR